MNRNLDWVYFRVEREGRWQNICFSDLTEEEQDAVTKDWNTDNLRELAKLMARTVKAMGDDLDLYGGYDD